MLAFTLALLYPLARPLRSGRPLAMGRQHSRLYGLVRERIARPYRNRIAV